MVQYLSPESMHSLNDIACVWFLVAELIFGDSLPLKSGVLRIYLVVYITVEKRHTCKFKAQQ